MQKEALGEEAGAYSEVGLWLGRSQYDWPTLLVLLKTDRLLGTGE